MDKKQRWNWNTNQNEDSPEHIEQFLNDLEALCKKHNLSISHEDGHGAFMIEPYHPSNIDWIREAYFVPAAPLPPEHPFQQ